MNSTVFSVNLDELRPLRDIWRFGANTCHAPLWLREDLRRHLQLAKRDLRFEYVRAHNIFSDRFDIAQSDGSFAWDKVLEAFDGILALGLKPFVELSSYPAALVDAEPKLLTYDFKTRPPRDWNDWYRLVRELVENLAARYGHEELKSWYFEVWNEPDIGFWTGTQADYFRLYDLAARAVKEVDVEFRIGGPATSKTAWIDEFLAHIQTPSADFGLEGVSRCDFVATHAYPSDLAFLPAAHGEVELQNSTIMRELFAEVRRKVDAALGEGFPIFCGEWNSSAGPLAWNHDECNNAPYIVKTMDELSPLCDGSLYWNLSDIYEEAGFHFEPLHGGYGLLSVNDLPKSSFHAFALLARHQGERVAATFSDAPEGVGAVVSTDGDWLRATFYFYREPDAGALEPLEIAVNWPALLPATLTVVEPGQGSFYETWRELGSPSYLNREIFALLEAASAPRVETGGNANLTLHPDTIVHFEARLRR
ncbi:MAG TPA: hypothetical protein VGB45_03565 [Abditibacterium sp.]|jgi:xylan 1,4-beta-xylosidase